MAFQEFSFAPDRRSVQGQIIHFSERPSRESGGRGFSQQDSLTWAIDKIYQRFTGIDPQTRRGLVATLVADVPLAHRNLVMLAAANYIVYHMRAFHRVNEMTPELYQGYFNWASQFIMGDATGKTPEEQVLMRANFKVTLLRYILYVLRHTTRMNPQPTIQ